MREYRIQIADSMKYYTSGEGIVVDNYLVIDGDHVDLDVTETIAGLWHKKVHIIIFVEE